MSANDTLKTPFSPFWLAQKGRGGESARGQTVHAVFRVGGRWRGRANLRREVMLNRTRFWNTVTTEGLATEGSRKGGPVWPLKGLTRSKGRGLQESLNKMFNKPPMLKNEQLEINHFHSEIRSIFTGTRPLGASSRVFFYGGRTWTESLKMNK